ncbi:MAG: M3 family oligoendopeptidase, partial [Bacteroidota bacterium]
MEITIEKKRNFTPKEFEITDWKTLKPFFDDLVARGINSKEDLQKLISDCSELSAIISENLAWRYIKMTCNTQDQVLVDNYTFFVNEISPHIAPIANEINKKIIGSPYISSLTGEHFKIYLRGLKNSIELFREKNIPLMTEMKNQEQKYGSISGAQTVIVDEKELTLQQAGVFLKSQDRNVRKSVYDKIQLRRDQDENELNELFSTLIKLRHQIALNTDFLNFRDYMHRELGRFDYTSDDCISFHNSVSRHIVPIMRELEIKRKNKLGIEDYRPWDTDFDEDGKPPLKPFENGKELTEKTIACFNEIDPFFGYCIKLMGEMGHLDLDSRIGKAPGGYNYPLYETGIPFIFMNSAGVLRDLVTMVHEGGHALHSIFTKDLPITENKSVPSEVAELASMSMELISMEHWKVFFSNEDELKRAKKEHLGKIIKTIPWIASIDKFQHWIYLNPEHTVKERYDAWDRITDEFGTGVINYDGIKNNLRRSWQGQLHLFEVPFYYIEYGFAQLGAIAMWKNYKENPSAGLESYKRFLKLGYTKSIPEIYEAAGIKFD